MPVLVILWAGLCSEGSSHTEIALLMLEHACQTPDDGHRSSPEMWGLYSNSTECVNAQGGAGQAAWWLSELLGFHLLDSPKARSGRKKRD